MGEELNELSALMQDCASEEPSALMQMQILASPMYEGDPATARTPQSPTPKILGVGRLGRGGRGETPMSSPGRLPPGSYNNYGSQDFTRQASCPGSLTYFQRRWLAQAWRER